MAKTKALISFAVTAKLICVIVFTYAKSRFSHGAAQMILGCSFFSDVQIIRRFIRKNIRKVIDGTCNLQIIFNI